MKRILSLSLFVLLLGLHVQAYGKYRNDTELSNLYNPNPSDPATLWSNQQVKRESHRKYRELMSQLGTVFAPTFLSPAETLGYMGYALSLNYALTTIDNKADYWQEGMHGSPSFGLQTIGFEYRKGMWFPLPGFEIAAGLKYLPESHMYAPHVSAKFSINEGYFKLPIPAIAVRGYGSRLMGNTEVDLTIASVDLSISKSIGMLSTVNATFYAGYNYLMIIPDSKVIDFTPGVDGLRQDPAGSPHNCSTGSEPDCAFNEVFDDQGIISKHRIFGGVRFLYHHLFVTAEVILSLDGSSSGDVKVLDSSGNVQTSSIKDATTKQVTFALSLGWDY